MNAATLLRVEALKISRRRPIIYFTIAVVLIALITVLPDYIVAKKNNQPVTAVFPQVWSMLVRGPAGTMTAFLLAIVIVMTVAGEFIWKTSRQNVIDGLSKNQWFTAKLLIVGALMVLFTFLLFATGAIVAALSPFTDFLRWEDVRMFRAFVLALLGQSAIAFFLAMTVRRDGPALGLYLIWPTVELLLAFLLSRIHKGWESVYSRFPMHVIMTNIQGSRGPAELAPALKPETNQILTLAYVGLFIGLAFWSYRARDL